MRQLIVVRESQAGTARGGPDLWPYALSTAPLRDVVLDGLRHLWCCHAADAPAERIGWTTPDKSVWVVPAGWRADVAGLPGPTVFYHDVLRLDPQTWYGQDTPAWLVIANGRWAAHVNHSLLERLLETVPADCLAVRADSDLLASRERLCLTPDNQVAGYRRLYADSMTPMPVPGDWPHFLLVRREALDVALQGSLLARFGEWASRCQAAGLRLQGAAVAGTAYDLGSAAGILAVSHAALQDPSCPNTPVAPASREPNPRPGTNGGISPEAHLIGPVRLGRQVTIEAGAVVVGPAVLCDGSTVGRQAIVDTAIVGTGVSVEPKQALRDCVVVASPSGPAPHIYAGGGPVPPAHVCAHHSNAFRTWPWFSYARCFKRLTDVVASVLVLILFAPIIPIIVLAVKLSSPGPVFFRDKRQGRHGEPFRCAKFRTMRQGADQMQDKLRFVCEVDGPQFKMADDPRITTVGRFLRETYLDEIPQFINVLCGQMSIVGPRPSPEWENTLCPPWRDARLSVRPGITGLWQVYRTRQPQRDFQEWILYDTQYVRDFSFGLDLWICWRTFRRMVGSFLSQF